MFRLEIQSSKFVYQAEVIEDINQDLAESKRPSDLFIVDKRVFELYQETLQSVIDPNPVLLIEAQESNKSFQAIEPYIQFVLDNGFRKNHRLLAIGGGIIQDITGFLADMLFRGVDWLFYPTTLLAQADSCIGSKTSINFGTYKNQLGGFHPPQRVAIDSHFLNTLSADDFLSGVGEIVKVHLLASSQDYAHLQSCYREAFTDRGTLQKLIFRALEIKKAYIEKDEFDQAERQIFNYGHTFGHAVESLTHYAIPHGIAVCFGMELANMVSHRMGFIDHATMQYMSRLPRANQGHFAIGGLGACVLLNAMRKDKKNTDNDINAILTKGPGQMFKTKLPPEAQGWIQTFLEQKPK